MKRLVLFAAVAVVVLARPELYKEKEDFQFSRSSSDEGSKSGFYGAQRGNMGGNYERSHNMDSLAQRHLSGAIAQVEGELGEEGAKTRTGSVFTSAKSAGFYGSGNYDLSNLGGRNFQEGTFLDNSQSSLASNAQYNAHSSLSKNSHYSNSHYRHSNYQNGYNGYPSQQQVSGLQGSDGTQGYQQYDYGGQAAAARFYSKSNGQSAFDQYNSNSHAKDSDAVINIDTIAQKPKQYQSQYSYHKEWEKHDTKPVILSIPTTNELTIPTNSELFEDLESKSQTSNKYYDASAFSSQNLATNINSGYSGLSQASRNSRLSSEANADAYNQLLGGNSNKPKTYQSSYSYKKSWERQGDPYVIVPAGGSSSVDSGTAQRYVSSANHQNSGSYRHGQHQSLNGEICDEHGYVRVPRSYDGQQLTQQFDNLEDLGQQTQEHWGKLEDLGQQTQTHFDKLEDLGQQTQTHWGNLEQLGQQTQNQFDKLEDLGQQTQNQWGDLQQFGQQAQEHQGRLEDLGQQAQTQFDKLEDLGQQQTQGQLEDLSQQTQVQLADLSQQTQSQVEDLTQQTQDQFDKLENLGHQTQTSWDNLGQETHKNWENLGQEIHNNWENLGQQIHNNWKNYGQEQHSWNNLATGASNDNHQTQNTLPTTDTAVSDKPGVGIVGQSQDTQHDNSQQRRNPWDRINNLRPNEFNSLNHFTQEHNRGLDSNFQDFQHTHHSWSSGYLRTNSQDNNENHNFFPTNSHHHNYDSNDQGQNVQQTHHNWNSHSQNENREAHDHISWYNRNTHNHHSEQSGFGSTNSNTNNFFNLWNKVDAIEKQTGTNNKVDDKNVNEEQGTNLHGTETSVTENSHIHNVNILVEKEQTTTSKYLEPFGPHSHATSTVVKTTQKPIGNTFISHQPANPDVGRGDIGPDATVIAIEENQKHNDNKPDAMVSFTTTTVKTTVFDDKSHDQKHKESSDVNEQTVDGQHEFSNIGQVQTDSFDQTSNMENQFQNQDETQLSQNTFNQLPDFGLQQSQSTDNFEQLHDFGQESANFQQEIQNFEQQNVDLQQQSVSGDITQLTQESNAFSPQQGVNQSPWQTKENIEQEHKDSASSLGVLPIEKEKSLNTQSTAQSEQISHSDVDKKDNEGLQSNTGTIGTITETATENPGFWKKVGSKLSNAKDKVYSWFSSK